MYHVGYNKLWDAAQLRLQHQKSIAQFFEKNAEELGFKRIKSFLSIGPGDGNLDFEMIKLIPNLEEYIAVEKVEDFAKQLKRGITECTDSKIRTSILACSMKEYGGPTDPVDIVFMSHVIYYVYDIMESQLRRAYDWLNPGGMMVIIVETGGTQDNPKRKELFIKKLNLTGGIECTSVTVATTLTKLGLNFTESVIPEPVDLQDGPGLREVLNLLAGTDLDDAQVQIALDVLRGYREPGSDVAMLEQSIFIIRKQ